ncbi:MAG: hypothetical protein K9M03_03885 [Kiritimatiellales bacterium]|nr:hypothetical protein [Kiritimatiellales bacterium]
MPERRDSTFSEFPHISASLAQTELPNCDDLSGHDREQVDQLTTLAYLMANREKVKLRAKLAAIAASN